MELAPIPYFAHMLKYRGRLCLAIACAIIPGLFTYLGTRVRASIHSESPRILDVAGLRIPQAVIDVGNVWSGGQSIHRIFTLENHSNSSARIVSVVSDCGCTTATPDSEVIQPRQSINIPVVFWPPAIIDGRGERFLRTITVTANTSAGTIGVPLQLTGFIEPDQSLRVYPVAVKFNDSPLQGTPPSLHFKGSAALLAHLPDRLIVVPGEDQKIFVGVPSPSDFGPPSTKDVKLLLGGGVKETGSWSSAIHFTSDTKSDGLIVRVSGEAHQTVEAVPKRLILTDDESGKQAVVHWAISSGRLPRIKSIESSLPVKCQIIESSSDDDNQTIRVRLAAEHIATVTGSILVEFDTGSASNRVVSIPVVILHENPNY